MGGGADRQPVRRAAPRPGANPEAAYQRYANTGLLLLDDIGATRDTEWTDMVLDRLIDHRWARGLPTIYTTNLPIAAGAPRTLKSELNARVYSRLATCVVVDMGDAPDRRLPPRESEPPPAQ